MCGRYVNFTPVRELARLFGAEPPGFEVSPRYNVAPSSPVVACRAAPDGTRELVLLSWGLVPAWAKDPKTGYRMINARAETAAVKPAFRAALRRRRCLIAADGFYEWKPGARRKQPYLVRMKSGEPFALAGLWERWQGVEGQVIESCTILVTEANSLVQAIHDRMPVIVRPQDYALWLDASVQDPARIQSLLAPYAAEPMEAFPVGFGVNKPSNDGSGLIAPAQPMEGEGSDSPPRR
jgi:putative SOS response-associated peptidase YedK